MIEGLIEGQEGEGEGEGEEEAGDGVFPNTRPTVAGERKTRQRRRREEERRNKVCVCVSVHIVNISNSGCCSGEAEVGRKDAQIKNERCL